LIKWIKSSVNSGVNSGVNNGFNTGLILISIHDQHECMACLYLKRNLITIKQSNQQFWDVFLIERTVVNTTFYSM